MTRLQRVRCHGSDGRRDLEGNSSAQHGADRDQGPGGRGREVAETSLVDNGRTEVLPTGRIEPGGGGVGGGVPCSRESNEGKNEWVPTGPSP
jgi:hypothetical protein